MDGFSQLLQGRIDAALVHTPDLDSDALAALLVDQTPVGAGLDAALEALPESAGTLLMAHGHWPRWDARAAELVGMGREQAALALLTLLDAGWVTPSHDFPLAVRAWRKARLGQQGHPLIEAAAQRAEAAFHHMRFAGWGDVHARGALERWGRWHDAVSVRQWAQVADGQDIWEQATGACRAWAAIELSRQARFRDWNAQAARWLDRAEEVSEGPQSRFFVAFLRALRAAQDHHPDSAQRVVDLEGLITDERERFFLLQARSVERGARGGDPRGPLEEGIFLAQHLGLRFREAALRILLAHADFPDSAAMRRQLELVDASEVVLTPFAQAGYHWAWALAGLAAEDLEEAAEHARFILSRPDVAQASTGLSWGVVAIAHHRAGEQQKATQALVELRRRATGVSSGFQQWAERVCAGGAWRPLPKLGWRVQEPLWVRRDGRAFGSAEREQVDLSRSPVSSRILRALAERPCTADTLIEAAWPGDASSYASLRDRLHSALRALRGKGLREHLVLEGEHYRLNGVELVDGVD